MTTLILEFKKIKSDGKKNIAPFIRPEKQKQFLMRVILMMCLIQFILRLCRIYKDYWEKVWFGLLIQL